MRVFGEAKEGKDLKKKSNDYAHAYMHAAIHTCVQVHICVRRTCMESKHNLRRQALGAIYLKSGPPTGLGLTDEAWLVNEPVSTSLYCDYYSVPPCPSFSCRFLEPSRGHHAVSQTLC